MSPKRSATPVYVARTKKKLTPRGVTAVNTPTRNQHRATVVRQRPYDDQREGGDLLRGQGRGQGTGVQECKKALADHVEEDDLTKRYPIVDNLGRRQKAILINESGLYALILSSRLNVFL